MRIYDRETKSYEEIEQFGAGKLEFLYNNAFGRLFLWLAVSPLVSGIYGKINSTKKSAKKIPDFIKEQGIDMQDFEDREYTSFNDFFTRKLREGKRIVDTNPSSLIAPADSKLLVYKIEEGMKMFVKGREYTVDEILGEGTLSDEFDTGYALVFRLCVGDYHRYCFPDRGTLITHKRIKGKLHTVSPISKDHKIYKENTREVSLLDTENFGKIAFVEVGALLVGKIVNSGATSFEKGEEKGYFEPGGSTVIVFVKDIINIDEDILRESEAGIETKVKYGEKIGELKC